MRPSPNDIAFAKMAAHAHYVSRTESAAALAEFRRRLARGERVTIDRVFLDLGLLLAVEVEETQRRQKRRVLFCHKCGGKLNVFGLRTGARVGCPRCHARLPVPPTNRPGPRPRPVPPACPRRAWSVATTRVATDVGPEISAGGGASSGA